MSKVATGLQDGVKLLELFGGSRKKKIFLWLPNPGKWLNFYDKKLLAWCLSFSVLFIPLNLFGLMSSTSRHGSCLSPISKNFFSSHVIVPYCWHLSSKLATYRVWNPSTFYILNLKVLHGLPIDKSPFKIKTVTKLYNKLVHANC